MSNESAPFACDAFLRLFNAFKTLIADSDFYNKFWFNFRIFFLIFYQPTDLTLALSVMLESSLLILSELEGDAFFP